MNFDISYIETGHLRHGLYWVHWLQMEEEIIQDKSYPLT